MKWFLFKYREGSKVSRIAFWVVLVAAALGLALIPVERYQDFRGPLEIIIDCLNAVMFVGIIVQGVSLHRDRRRRRGLSWASPKQADRF
ncbi:MAG: hypothetical protein ACRYG2_18815 [Janthinobacterium lividum]